MGTGFEWVFRPRLSVLLLGVAVALCARVPATEAAWVADGIALSNGVYDQTQPAIISDGAGGAIVVWASMSLDNDIRAQRVSGSGDVLWNVAGNLVCSASNSQEDPAIVSDGAGGAIVVWSDFRSGSSYDIYAQRINSSGVTQWTTGGVVVCAAANNQLQSTIVSDGAGGAIVAWIDYRSGSNYDIYAQRINSSGVAQWTANGIPVCTAGAEQSAVAIASDGAGGAILTWQDRRSGASYDVYAQRMNGSGVSQWTGDGIVICAQAQNQALPDIIPDDAGGAIIAWTDGRNSPSFEVYAQRVNSSGASLWAANGAVICAPSYASNVAVTSDGSGGAIVTWEASTNLYAQRVNASGVVQWVANGITLSAESNYQTYPAIVPDGASGAIVAWSDGRSSASDLGQNEWVYARVLRL